MNPELTLALAGAKAGYSDAIAGKSKWSENRTTQSNYTVYYHMSYEACRDGLTWDEIKHNINARDWTVKTPC